MIRKKKIPSNKGSTRVPRGQTPTSYITNQNALNLNFFTIMGTKLTLFHNMCIIKVPSPFISVLDEGQRCLVTLMGDSFLHFFN